MGYCKRTLSNSKVTNMANRAKKSVAGIVLFLLVSLVRCGQLKYCTNSAKSIAPSRMFHTSAIWIQGKTRGKKHCMKSTDRAIINRIHSVLYCISFRSQVKKVWKNRREQYLCHWCWHAFMMTLIILLKFGPPNSDNLPIRFLGHWLWATDAGCRLKWMQWQYPLIGTVMCFSKNLFNTLRMHFFRYGLFVYGTAYGRFVVHYLFSWAC